MGGGGGEKERERDPFRQRRRFEYGTILLLAFLLPHSAGNACDSSMNPVRTLLGRRVRSPCRAIQLEEFFTRGTVALNDMFTISLGHYVQA